MAIIQKKKVMESSKAFEGKSKQSLELRFIIYK